ncbi:YtxH domain-containing protein [Paenibacillus sp. LMG 31456]|uniref:YtxH domain-containing protein n=1 Tax=Paenibacillus foliorum TaxID=2654974 RepID=A0A972H220_9BACL|nr:YtxH domain-containing protein [Paenibacillus foliorum]NOU98012.1 YtxH domain-containing protein [Paenibacillus foliorum]
MAAEKKGKDLLIGAVVGTLLGAVTALLFAPKSGRELRADISEGVHNVTEKTQQVAGTVADKSKQIAGTISDKTQHAVQTIGRQTSEWAGKAKETALSWKHPKAESLESLEAPVAATVVESEENEK